MLPDHLLTAIEAAQRQRGQFSAARFAPTPSGCLHLGNLRTALLSWLQARLQGSAWLLRIDDLDTPRNRAGAIPSILSDLHWLGLHWDGEVIQQSRRRGLYGSVLSALRRDGSLYPCRCSRRLLRQAAGGRSGAPGPYPGHCRGLAPDWGWRQERLPSWRLRLPPGRLVWEERLGRQGGLDASADVGDVVVRRADGVVAYHLATAVDELLLGISEVWRGEDLWSATAPQVAVMAALGATPPRYGHLPLWRDPDGRRLAKREGSAGLKLLREAGMEAPDVIGRLAASVGLVPGGSRLSAAELAREWRGRDLEHQLRSQASAAVQQAQQVPTGKLPL
ncbi:tRNA glutamyl-Q(34) synthetase GluQRS [Synechococcus sp. RSCCF101]|uniref:tRNA glutamyl-Q(34) synthetase GluQRS n=1 Tax=Synechococcus sp. RSCCF101 TaxID=2511069 RepID=UPI001243B34C|nr:tRNA glutamyl-Q(34) synthetase GluQRS [Synechococcus sp. RSCCF101]QEY31046.1 tRNA glutamyl-Q(34) synthetase GluQRS [Synechococcus sp. RSCCF101]